MRAQFARIVTLALPVTRASKRLELIAQRLRDWKSAANAF
jgi:hypothetical protein